MEFSSKSLTFVPNKNECLMNRPNLFALLCVLMLAWLPVSAQEYSNLVKPGSHPGSSVCRAGDKWIHLQNSIPDNYLCNDTMAVEKKYLMRLYPHGSLTENQLPTFAGRLQESASFTLETEVVTKGNVEAGLSVYRVSNGHFDFFVSKKQVALRCKLKSIDYVVKSVPRLRKGSVKLRIRSNGDMYFFDYSLDGKRYHELASMNCSLMSTEVAGGSAGIKLGMFAEGKPRSGHADFAYFRYEEK